CGGCFLEAGGGAGEFNFWTLFWIVREQNRREEEENRHCFDHGPSVYLMSVEPLGQAFRRRNWAYDKENAAMVVTAGLRSVTREVPGGQAEYLGHVDSVGEVYFVVEALVVGRVLVGVFHIIEIDHLIEEEDGEAEFLGDAPVRVSKITLSAIERPIVRLQFEL